jgi:hypothetical protein
MLDLNVSESFDSGAVVYVVDAAEVAEEATEPPTCHAVDAILERATREAWPSDIYRLATAIDGVAVRVLPIALRPILMRNTILVTQHGAREETGSALVLLLLADAGVDPATVDASELDRLHVGLFGLTRRACPMDYVVNVNGAIVSGVA